MPIVIVAVMVVLVPVPVVVVVVVVVVLVVVIVTGHGLAPAPSMLWISYLAWIRLYHTQNGRDSTSCRGKDLPMTNYKHPAPPMKCMSHSMNLCQHPTVPAIPRKAVSITESCRTNRFQLRLQTGLHRVIHVLDLVLCGAPISFPSLSEFRQTNTANRYIVSKQRSIDTNKCCRSCNQSEEKPKTEVQVGPEGPRRSRGHGCAQQHGSCDSYGVSMSFTL